MIRSCSLALPAAALLSLTWLLPPPAASERRPDYNPAADTPAESAAKPPTLQDLQGKVDQIQGKVDELAAQAKALGLDPATATPEQIKGFLENQALAVARAQLGLGADATWKDVFGPAGKEAFRQRAAQQLGLPADAPWGEVVKGLSELARQGAARSLGLPAAASWADISASAQQKGAQYKDALNASPAGKAIAAAAKTAAAAPKPKLQPLPSLTP